MATVVFINPIQPRSHNPVDQCSVTNGGSAHREDLTPSIPIKIDREPQNKSGHFAYPPSALTLRTAAQRPDHPQLSSEPDTIERVGELGFRQSCRPTDSTG